MKFIVPLLSGLAFGVMHFLAVGVLFIAAHGNGEGLLIIVLIDLPLFLLARTYTPVQLFNSRDFNFWLFPVVGTLMYAIIGCLLGYVAASLVRYLQSRSQPTHDA